MSKRKLLLLWLVSGVLWLAIDSLECRLLPPVLQSCKCSDTCTGVEP